MVKLQLDTLTSNRKSLHVRRSQGEQRLTAARKCRGTAYLRSRVIVLFWVPGAHRPSGSAGQVFRRVFQPFPWRL
jgi:hypothetical protein